MDEPCSLKVQSSFLFQLLRWTSALFSRTHTRDTKGVSMTQKCLVCDKACDESSGWKNAEEQWVHRKCFDMEIAKKPPGKSVFHWLLRWVWYCCWTYTATFIIVVILPAGVPWKFGLYLSALGPFIFWSMRRKNEKDREWNRSKYS